MADPAGHILVVGASSGIGRAVAEHFAGQGSIVTALARRADKLAELTDAGIATVAADVTDLAAIGGVLQAAVAERGLLTGLVYCAGVQIIKPLRSLGVDEVARLYTTNLVAPTLFAAAFGSARVSTRDAVFCAYRRSRPSARSRRLFPMRLEGGSRRADPRSGPGTRTPPRGRHRAGWLDTEMTQAHARLYGDDFKAALEKRSPAGAATVDSVVDAIAFLMSPRARHVTGEILGGRRRGDALMEGCR